LFDRQGDTGGNNAGNFIVDWFLDPAHHGTDHPDGLPIEILCLVSREPERPGRGVQFGQLFGHCSVSPRRLWNLARLTAGAQAADHLSNRRAAEDFPRICGGDVAHAGGTRDLDAARCQMHQSAGQREAFEVVQIIVVYVCNIQQNHVVWQHVEKTKPFTLRLSMRQHKRF
jgi:hypothetical protein